MSSYPYQCKCQDHPQGNCQALAIYPPNMTDRDRHATITKDELMARLSSVGAYKTGVAAVRPVPDDVMNHYNEWLKRGCHAGMTYLENHLEIRRNPELLLPGAKSIICCAFNYYTPPSDSGTPEKPVGNQLKWACYALGDDYHEAIRDRLARCCGRTWVHRVEPSADYTRSRLPFLPCRNPDHPSPRSRLPLHTFMRLLPPLSQPLPRPRPQHPNLKTRNSKLKTLFGCPKMPLLSDHRTS